MIVSGGENVYPLEVEQTLGAHPEVREAAVIGVDDHQFGQRLSAFVVLNPDGSVTADQLKAHVKEHLAGVQGAARGHAARRAAPQQHRQGHEARAQPTVVMMTLSHLWDRPAAASSLRW